MAKKRADGEGTLFYRKDRNCWVAQVPIGRTPSGRIRRKTFYGKTQDEALEKRKQYEREQYLHEAEECKETNDDVNPSRNDFTVNQLLDLWLDSRECSWSSLERYVQVADTHIRPRFGEERVADMTPYQIQLFYNEKKKTNLSPRSIEYIHVTLNSALNHAVMLEIVKRNPVEKVERPKGESVVKPKALTEEGCKLLLDVAKDDWYYPVYVTALQTGMRMGELFGLYWEDVDFVRKVIMVRKAAKRMKDGRGIGKLKTKASYRTISISDYLIDVLEAHQEEQEESFGEIDLVFTNTAGTLVNPANFRRNSWYPLREKAHEHKDNKDTNGKKKTDFKSLRFHDLRHTHATLLLMAGVPPKAVQSRLGHSTIQMTMDTYGHLLPGIDEQAVEVLDDIFA